MLFCLFNSKLGAWSFIPVVLFVCCQEWFSLTCRLVHSPLQLQDALRRSLLRYGKVSTVLSFPSLLLLVLHLLLVLLLVRGASTTLEG
jgi:hypothetical protein